MAKTNHTAPTTASASRFSLGTVVATPAALAALQATGQSPIEFLHRHVSGDWGDVGASDALENELALKQGLRLLSVYALADGTRLWIITEADRSATTLLLPEDY